MGGINNEPEVSFFCTLISLFICFIHGYYYKVFFCLSYNNNNNKPWAISDLDESNQSIYFQFLKILINLMDFQEYALLS